VVQESGFVGFNWHQLWYRGAHRQPSPSLSRDLNFSRSAYFSSQDFPTSSHDPFKYAQAISKYIHALHNIRLQCRLVREPSG
jgi:hypothetical protein